MNGYTKYKERSIINGSKSKFLENGFFRCITNQRHKNRVQLVFCLQWRKLSPQWWVQEVCNICEDTLRFRRVDAQFILTWLVPFHRKQMLWMEGFQIEFILNSSQQMQNGSARCINARIGCADAWHANPFNQVFDGTQFVLVHTETSSKVFQPIWVIVLMAHLLSMKVRILCIGSAHKGRPSSGSHGATKLSKFKVKFRVQSSTEFYWVLPKWLAHVDSSTQQLMSSQQTNMSLIW